MGRRGRGEREMSAGRVDWGQTCGGVGLMWGQCDEGVCVWECLVASEDV